MILAEGLSAIFNEFDFTDSIISEIKWENNFFDLAITMDYYWDIQEGKETTRLLKLLFKDVMKADFQTNKMLANLPKSEIHPDSWYTIVRLSEETNNVFIKEENLLDFKSIQIFTYDHFTPLLAVVFREIVIVEAV
ncbi:hypothetical protein ACFFNY_17205 [Paenibacillus hodogayensis]|uniref:Uncharacterized protein n=1 Tax=Paenibacillus hodogayensis TaxID=279208 RepID=A0ABV5VYV2_9BACL